MFVQPAVPNKANIPACKACRKVMRVEFLPLAICQNHFESRVIVLLNELRPEIRRSFHVTNCYAGVAVYLL